MFVVYHKDTTRFLRILRNRHWQDAKFASMGAAKAGLGREVKAGRAAAADYLIAESGVFYSTIEKQVTVKNILSGRDVVQSANTPRCCDPSSELYHSM